MFSNVATMVHLYRMTVRNLNVTYVQNNTGGSWVCNSLLCHKEPRSLLPSVELSEIISDCVRDRICFADKGQGGGPVEPVYAQGE